MELTVEKFIKIRNFIYDKAGIFYETKKIYFVKKRLNKRIEANSIDSVDAYYNLLKYHDKTGVEFQNFLNLLTVNETYFYREKNQLDSFSNYCLNEILKEKRKNKDSLLRIWSAGCSTGEEPYSLAILIRETIPDFLNWNIEILASDIDTGVINKAKLGIYNERSIRHIPEATVKKYFKYSNEEYHINENIKKLVKFKHLNLFDNIKMRLIKNLDFIFCRNVLIYFDDASKKAVVANFYDSLRPGGYIFLGHSEAVTRIHTAFKVKRVGSLIVHQKPEI